MRIHLKLARSHLPGNINANKAAKPPSTDITSPIFGTTMAISSDVTNHTNTITIRRLRSCRMTSAADGCRIVIQMLSIAALRTLVKQCTIIMAGNWATVCLRFIYLFCIENGFRFHQILVQAWFIAVRTCQQTGESDKWCTF